MHGGWSSVLLVVAAALEPVEVRKDEQQQQQQDEKQLERGPHSCVAAVALVYAGGSSDRILLRRQCGVPCQTAALRTGKLVAHDAVFRPMYMAAPDKKQQPKRDQNTIYMIRESSMWRRHVHAVCQAMEWQRPAAAEAAEPPRSTQGALLASPRRV